MSEGQILWVICTPCSESKEKDYGFKLAGRVQVGWFDTLTDSNQLDNWFHKHSKCGGRGHPDHFQLAHSYERDHDQPKPKPVAKAVQEALQ